MRVNVSALASSKSRPRSFSVPVTVQIQPTRGMAGDHLYTTDSHSLLTMLKCKTDLSGPVLDNFTAQLRLISGARLSGVELSDRTLKEIGYFVD